MPRKSFEHLSVVASLDDRRERLRPPAHLPAPVAAIFSEVVASVAIGHFRDCDRPVLTQLATVMHVAQQAAAALERDGLVLEGRPNPHLGVLERAGKAIANLSAKLRIVPSSRLDRKDAGATTRGSQTRGLDAVDELLNLEDADEK